MWAFTAIPTFSVICREFLERECIEKTENSLEVNDEKPDIARVDIRMMIESNNHIVVMEAWSSRKTECTFAKKLESTRVY